MYTMEIPVDERTITDEHFFSALNLEFPGLENVKRFYEGGQIQEAKQQLLHYYQTRSQVKYLFDYRQLPLTPINTDEDPYSFQASLGLSGSLKEFCLYGGRKMMEHIYVVPGRGRGEFDLGRNFETPLHFSFLNDQGKKRNHLNLFVRGTSFEYLYVLYHETGDKKVLQTIEDLLHLYFETYPLVISNTDSDAARFQFDEDRDVMSAGFLSLTYTGLLYTRIPYEIDPELAFDILKHLWFLGIQFRRFDQDYYRPYNHHMWERGLIPFILGTMFPEIPAFSEMKAIGAKVICRHVCDDFNEDGGYNEHSIAYWSGAALGEMLYRGIYLARINGETLLDAESRRRMEASFRILAQIAPPQSKYPSLGDNQGPSVEPILEIGEKMFGHPACREVLNIRRQGLGLPHYAPLDYHNKKTGFVCGKSGYDRNASYFLMSAKTNCGYSGHNHMDMLSLFITIRGKSIIEEPDSGRLYHAVRMASPHRGYMYNMTSHNTVLAFGKPIAPDEMYADSWGVYRPDTPIQDFLSTPLGMYAEAYHDAYTFCLHTRRILFHRTAGLIVQDRIDRGNRAPAAHIQRWHLAKGITAAPVNKTSLLLTCEEVKVLCIWDRPAAIQIYRQELPYPEIITDPSELTTVIDVSFLGEEEKTLDYAATEITAVFLDVTGRDLSKLNSDIHEEELFALMKFTDMDKALEAFDAMSFI